MDNRIKVSLQFIQLPPNLQRIGIYTFYGCSSLEAVYLPPTITWIGERAFQFCRSLRIINIPDSVEHIGWGVIAGCNSLMTVEIKEVTTEEKSNGSRTATIPSKISARIHL